MPGKHGTPGAPGRDGRDGRDGAKGDQGLQGPPGDIGSSCVKGQKGAKGEPKTQGPTDQKGLTGSIAPKNWKECVWKNLNDNKDSGVIKVSRAYAIDRYHAAAIFQKAFSLPNTNEHLWDTGLHSYKTTFSI